MDNPIIVTATIPVLNSLEIFNAIKFCQAKILIIIGWNTQSSYDFSSTLVTSTFCPSIKATIKADVKPLDLATLRVS